MKTAIASSRKSYINRRLFEFELFILLIFVFVCKSCVFIVYIVICVHNAHLPENCHVNCRSIRDRAKRLAFITNAKTLDAHVLCVQETFSKPQDEFVRQNDWEDKNQAVFNSNAEISTKTDAGTAILLNHPSLQFGNIRKDSGGRILTAKIQCDSFVFQVINVYVFPSSYPKQKREGFFNQIYDFANINLTKILCGKFNCVENPTQD